MITIHPYKGYLNTNFSVHNQSAKSLHYQVFSSKNDIINEAQVGPNEPHIIKFPIAGHFVVQFEDGTKIDITVEDAYKFGGSKFKTAFVFDNCPWSFIIMHDRTYFYNKDTEESYMELISPDIITEISKKYVIFQNNGQEQQTVFSLEEQKPILFTSNICYFTGEIIVWEEKNKDKNISELVVYSLTAKSYIHRIQYDYFTIDKTSQKLYFVKGERIKVINLQDQDNAPEPIWHFGDFISFVREKFAVCYYRQKSPSTIIIYDLENGNSIGEIVVNGNLARVNERILIDINDRERAMRQFDFKSTDFPEASINADYSEYDIFPTGWQTFYNEKITFVSSKETRFIKRNSFSAIGTDTYYEMPNCKNTIFGLNYFCYYGDNESIVVFRDYDQKHIHIKHHSRLFHFNDIILLQCGEDIFQLNQNDGYWEPHLKGDYDLSYFNDFGILRNKKSNECINSDDINLGGFISYSSSPLDCIQTNAYIIYSGGFLSLDQEMPSYVSPSLTYGVKILNNKVLFFYSSTDDKVLKHKEILKEIFDRSQYSNVLLSEDGKHIIYRNNNESVLLDIATRRTFFFPNLSFINHVNGTRPLFKSTGYGQARLINPINGLPIDIKLLTEYQFISPDQTLYADTELEKYIEYYNRIQRRIITKEEYRSLINQFQYPYTVGNNSNDFVKTKQNRMNFIKEHLDFFIQQLRVAGWKDRNRKELMECLIDEKSIFGVKWFIDLFIEKRGIAIIRSITDKSEVVRIPLGPPLWFLNYASFSYDSRYVAIAGRYPNDSGYGGLFLLYDMHLKKTVLESKNSYAVWITAFTKSGDVAAYTSDPNTLVLSSCCYDKYKANDLFSIKGVNFLTFSPNGRYFACSHQGYVKYHKKDGTINPAWGHQPSSYVSIRSIDNPEKEITHYSDLCEMGISGADRSVASVSFSKNNERLMMVGNDGTVIIRNVHLDD